MKNFPQLKRPAVRMTTEHKKFGVLADAIDDMLKCGAFPRNVPLPEVYLAEYPQETGVLFSEAGQIWDMDKNNICLDSGFLRSLDDETARTYFIFTAAVMGLLNQNKNSSAPTKNDFKYLELSLVAVFVVALTNNTTALSIASFNVLCALGNIVRKHCNSSRNFPYDKEHISLLIESDLIKQDDMFKLLEAASIYQKRREIKGRGLE